MNRYENTTNKVHKNLVPGTCSLEQLIERPTDGDTEFSDASHMSSWQIIPELWKGLWQSTVCVSLLQSSVTVICKSFARLVGRLTVSQLSLARDQPFHESLRKSVHPFVSYVPFCDRLLWLHFSANWHENKHTPSQTYTWPLNFCLQGRNTSAAKGLRTERPLELLVTAHTFIFCIRYPCKILTVRAKQSTTTFS